MQTKFIKIAFADSGDKTTVPNTSVDGTVDYQQGFGIDYSRDQDSDPLAKNVPRDQTNQLFFDITSNLQQYQTEGFPQFISTSDNGGTPYPYRIGACVAYEASPDVWKNYVSLKNNNTSLPTVAADWSELSSFVLADNIASQAEAVAGTNNTKIMTPLRVAQAVPSASTTTLGRTRYATSAEVTTGTASDRAVTPASMAGRTINAGNGLTGGGTLNADRTIDLGTPSSCSGSTSNSASASTHTHQILAASTTVSGATRYATSSESISGSSASEAVTPAGMKAALQSSLVMYEGGTVDNLDFPIGDVVFVAHPSPLPPRNSIVPIYLNNGSNNSYVTSGSAGDKLLGTWRSRGTGEGGGEFNVMCKRIS